MPHSPSRPFLSVAARPRCGGPAAYADTSTVVAAAVRTFVQRKASFVYCILGRAYQSLEDFSQAIEHHMEHLTMAKEVGDRA